MNRWSQAKHRCNRCTLFQRASLVDINSPSSPVEPETTIDALDVLCFKEVVWVDQITSSAPVEPTPLRSLHRCNDASLDTVSEPPTATIWTQRDRLNRRHQLLTRRFFRWSWFFCSGLLTAMWPSPLYIRAPPSSFKLPLTHWIPEATLEKKKECFEPWDEDLELEFDPNLKKTIIHEWQVCLSLGSS